MDPAGFLFGSTSNENLRYTDLAYQPLMSVIKDGGSHLTLEEVKVSVEVDGGKACGPKCIPKEFDCDFEDKVIKNPIRKYKRVAKKD